MDRDPGAVVGLQRHLGGNRLRRSRCRPISSASWAGHDRGECRGRRPGQRLDRPRGAVALDPSRRPRLLAHVPARESAARGGTSLIRTHRLGGCALDLRPGSGRGGSRSRRTRDGRRTSERDRRLAPPCGRVRSPRPGCRRLGPGTARRLHIDCPSHMRPRPSSTRARFPTRTGPTRHLSTRRRPPRRPGPR